MEHKSLEDIVVKLPIFGSFTVEVGDDTLSNEKKKELSPLFESKKINLKCIECNKEYPFSVDVIVRKQLYEPSNYWISIGPGKTFIRINDICSTYSTVRLPTEDEGIIEYTFICQMNLSHYYKMYLHYKLENGTYTFRKVGQIPLNTDLQNTYSNDYKVVLNRYHAFEDYRHFEQSSSRNLLAGACTYLRRILEKIVYKMLDESGISEVDKKKLTHFDEVIKTVKPYFDNDIQDVVDSSYGLLSKGIHELNDSEIETFYVTILEVINIQLQSEKEKIQSEAKRKEIKSKLDAAVAIHKK